jgi:cytochrome P450
MPRPPFVDFAPFDPPPAALYEALARLRAVSPVVRAKSVQPPSDSTVYLLGREVCDRALVHPQLLQAPEGAYQELRAIFKNHNAVFRVFSQTMLFIDPPEHTRLRRPLQAMFSSSRIAALENWMSVRARELARRSLDAGRFDVVKDFGEPFVLDVLFKILGLEAADPAWLRQRMAYVTDALDFPTERPYPFTEAEAACRELVDYIEDALRGARPPADTVLAAMLELERNGDWNHDDLVASCLLFLFAGQETVVDSLGSFALALEERPEQREEVVRAREEAWPAIIEELLRFDAPVSYVARVASGNIELGGYTIEDGQTVVACLASANRDPAWCERPDELDFHRPIRRSLAFGTGLHTCLGQHVARMELRAALRALYAEAPEWHVRTDAVAYRPNALLRGLTSAPAEAALASKERQTA